MRQWIHICIADGALGGWLCFLISSALITASFILPPTGVIDSSVILATGELIAFGVIFRLPEMIKSVKDGKSIKVSHGETSVEVSSEKE